MGAWGARIYEDDTALDIRSEFLDKLKSGAEVADAERAIRDEYFEDDEADVAKLALACVELETARLTDETKHQALEVIASGRQYQLWLEEADKEQAGLRSRELTLIKKYLENYDGYPVRRKSWKVLQRETSSGAGSGAKPAEFDPGEKLDDFDWHEGDAAGDNAEEKQEHGAVHIAAFVYWLLTRKYLAAAEPELLKAAGPVADGKMRPTQFLIAGLDGKLFTGEAKPEVREFVKAYYQGGREFYMTDFEDVLCQDRDVYSFLPTVAEYELMAKRIDERLADWQSKPYMAANSAVTIVKQRIPLAFWFKLIGYVIASASLYWIFRHK